MKTFLQKLFFDTRYLNDALLDEEELNALKKFAEIFELNYHLFSSLGETPLNSALSKVLTEVKASKNTALSHLKCEQEHARFTSELKALQDKYEKKLKSGRKLPMQFFKVEIPISQANLSARAQKALQKLDIKSISELENISLWQLQLTRNVGNKTVLEIKNKAAEYGINMTNSNHFPRNYKEEFFILK